MKNMATPGLDPKFKNMILFFISLARGRTSKIGLMKYLFYSDFTSYRDFDQQISSVNYVKLPYGPCPNQWEKYLRELEKAKLIKKETRLFIKNDGSVGRGEYYTLDKGIFNDEQFTTTEVRRMKEIYSVLKNFTTTQLSKMSHEEVAYIEATDRSELNVENAYHISLLDSDSEEEDVPRSTILAFSRLEKRGVI